uniref:Uncharacterized protein n=1 Tax=Arundo donax TaxID=35708 RepID=A0A0A8YK20_ARUDO
MFCNQRNFLFYLARHLYLNMHIPIQLAMQSNEIDMSNHNFSQQNKLLR